MGMFGMTWQKMISFIHLMQLSTCLKVLNSLKDALVSLSSIKMIVTTYELHTALCWWLIGNMHFFCRKASATKYEQ